MCVEILPAQELLSSISGIRQVRLPKKRTFSMGDKTVTVDVEETVKDYY